MARIKGKSRLWDEFRSRTATRNSSESLKDHLEEILERDSINCVIDVGANAGSYGILLRDLGYRGRIHSFEPVASAYGKLQQVCAADASWFCHRLALGETPGMREIGVTGSTLLSSFFQPNEFARRTFGPAAEVVREELVEVCRLDDRFDELVRDLDDPCVLLRLDTQGSELDILRGGEECLTKIDLLQSEMSVQPLYCNSTTYMDALPEYRKLGFEVTGFFPVFRNPGSMILAEFECLMARPAEKTEIDAIALPLEPQVVSVSAAEFGATRPKKRISVLVVTCGDSANLRECLRRIRPQADALDAELLLVVNAPEHSLEPASAESLHALCDRIVYEPAVGKSRALNTGVRHCRGEVIAFTDDDTLPQAAWLESLTAQLLKTDRPLELVGIGGPVVPRYESSVPPWYQDLVDGRSTSFLGPKHDLGSETVDYVSPYGYGGDLAAPLGANCAYRREVFEHYGYHDDLGPNRETGGRGGEDWELGLRLLMEGFRLTYLPEAVVHHPVSETRMTLDYALKGTHQQGVEAVKVGRALRLPPVNAGEARDKLQRKLRRQAFPLRRWLRPSHYRAAEFEIEYLRGVLAEIEK